MRLAARHGGCLAGVEPTARTPLQGGTPWWEQTRVPHTLLKRFAQDPFTHYVLLLALSRRCEMRGLFVGGSIRDVPAWDTRHSYACSV